MWDLFVDYATNGAAVVIYLIAAATSLPLLYRPIFVWWMNVQWAAHKRMHAAWGFVIFSRIFGGILIISLALINPVATAIASIVSIGIPLAVIGWRMRQLELE